MQCNDVTETECRIMMMRECRWEKQKVCDNLQQSPAQRPRQAPRPRTWRSPVKKDPIQQLLEPLANVVQTLLLEPIGKLLNPSSNQSQCKWVPREWCEEVPKETTHTIKANDFIS